MEERPVFTDQFYIDKFMEIQQQNILLYKTLLKIKEDPSLRNIVEMYLGPDIFNVLNDNPA